MRSGIAYRFFSFFFLRITIAVLLGLLSYPARTQSYYTRNFTMEDGLPSNIVRSVFKDSRRIMWIGTGAGLCRFNGREFTVYNSSNGLAAENIFDITEDKQGNLWIGAMAEGISKFDGRKFTNYSTKEGLVCNEVRRVWYSKKFNIVLIGTNKGCSVFDGNKFYSLTAATAGSLNDTYIVLGFLEKVDYIQLHAYGIPKLFRYYPATHKFIEDTYTLDNSPSCSPVTGKNGDTVWAWSRSGIRVWNKGIKQSFDSLGQPFHLAVDDDKNVWIAAWAEAPSGPSMPGGLYVYNGREVRRMSEKTGISDPGVWTVFYDSVFHIVWVGTLHQGLFRIPFPYIEWYNASFFGLSSMKINDIHADKHNNLWIATSHEIIRKNSDGGFYIYPNQLIRSAQYESFIKSHPLMQARHIDKEGSYEKYRSDTSGVCFFCAGEDSHHAVYISGGFGLNRFRDLSGRGKPDVIPIEGNIWVFAFDEADTLFGSSYWDMGIWHCALYPGLMYPKRFYYQAEKDNAPSSPVRMISRRNEIWSESRVGGLYLSLDGKNFAFSKTDKSLPQSINDICFDGSRNIVVGANNGEVLILGLEGEKLKLLYRLSAKDGIVGKSIRWVQEDSKRNLFFGSDKGLHLVNLDELQASGKPRIRFYSHETGYFDLSGKRAVIDMKGDLWIATDTRLCQIDHDVIQKNPAHKAKLILTGLEINNIPLSQIPGYHTDVWFGSPVKALSLSYGQNNLVFYFDALNYLDADQQSFRYRLLPIIKTWSNFSSEHKAVFTTLSPGNYLLEIQSVNPLDKNQVSNLSYSFKIMPPFYIRWWFMICVLVLLGGISVVLLRFRFRQIRQQEKQKADVRNELNSIEMKALKAQMNPHFIFNAINAIQSFILSNNVDQALYYLSIFAKLVRKTLENATKDFIPLCEEMEYIHFYIELEKMRYEGQFTSEIDIDPQLPIETTMIPPMIIQPFVENAIKHGLLKIKDAGVLKISIRKLNDSQYLVVIEDNGIGRQQSVELKKGEGRTHNSKGLELTNARIRLLNEMSHTGKYHIATIDLYNADGSPKGTRVEVNFPL